MAKVEFDPGIESVTGILMGTDPFYIRRYPGKNGVMHIVQARPTARVTLHQKPKSTPVSCSQKCTGDKNIWRF